MDDLHFNELKDFYDTGITMDIEFRLENLRKLYAGIIEYERIIIDSLSIDLGRPAIESYSSEILTVLQELKFTIKNLKKWAKPQRVKTPWLLKPGGSRLCYEPYGTVLIIAPWNYPFQLLMLPLIGAVAAGNCVIVKPSELVPHTAQAISDLIAGTFPPHFVKVVTGDADAARRLLAQNTDYIFFTGGTNIGREVMRAAAENLTPVTLELGGKCPCIVDKESDFKRAAKRIAWGKFFNAGQTCLAPDYLYVHESVKERLVNSIQSCINDFYGDEPIESPDYGRIVNGKHFDRIVNLIPPQRRTAFPADREKLYIPPTILEEVSWADEVMNEEVFGPVLPVLSFETVKEAIAAVNCRPKPLSIYVFSKRDSVVNQIIEMTGSGGVTVNDVLIQAVSSHVPFGGVGESGMGRYRGKSSFTTFSNGKAVIKRKTWPDWKFRYPPYGKSMDKLKKILGLLRLI